MSILTGDDMMESTTHDDRIIYLWQRPVHIQIRHGWPQRIDGPTRALLFMETEWPGPRGYHYHTARAACIGVTEQRCDSEVARDAFIAAAMEARLIA
ncbi:Protein of unknown function [Rhizobium sp. NFR07]|nr:Protein of unknown function [Rhizobium sp. NFR07]